MTPENMTHWNQRAAGLLHEKEHKIAWARRRDYEGWTLFAIAQELGVTKEWLRTYAGLR